MARVLVIGAGLAGLACALEATTAGHHVVVLERSSRIGGRGTSQNIDGLPIGFGPHLFLKKGPLHNLARKLSGIKMKVSPIQLHRTEIIGSGIVRPIDNTRLSLERKRLLRDGDSNDPITQGCRFLSSWDSQHSGERFHALQKKKLLVSNEGWSGMVGRLAAALDEVGVFIECGLEVTQIDGEKATLSDGREIEVDAIVLACGPAATRKLVRPLDAQQCDSVFSKLERTTASFIEVGLDSKPLLGKQAVVDGERRFAVLDYRAIQPRLGLEGSHLSAVAVGGLAGDSGPTLYSSANERLEALRLFLNQRAAGWDKHIVHQSQQEKITILDSGDFQIPQNAFANHKVLLAGAWVESEYELSDAAVYSGRSAGRLISSLID